jgi:hypothetical protein
MHPSDHGNVLCILQTMGMFYADCTLGSNMAADPSGECECNSGYRNIDGTPSSAFCVPGMFFPTLALLDSVPPEQENGGSIAKDPIISASLLGVMLNPKLLTSIPRGSIISQFIFLQSSGISEHASVLRGIEVR